MNIQEAYKFCPRCTATFMVHGKHLVCSSCGYVFFANPSPSAIAVIKNSKNEYLLTQRKRDPGRGMLEVPGGFIEVGETAEAALRRELKEELSLEVNEVAYIDSYTGEYEYQGIFKPVFMVGFLVRISDDVVVTPGDDVAAYKFYAAENMPFDKIFLPVIERFSGMPLRPLRLTKCLRIIELRHGRSSKHSKIND